nr:hypothetical protein [Myxococcota bacterium]
MSHPEFSGAQRQNGPSAWARAVVLRGHSPESVREISAGVGPAHLSVGSAPGGWMIQGAGVLPEHLDLVWDGASLWVVGRDGDVTIDGERIGGSVRLAGRHIVEFGSAALCVDAVSPAVAERAVDPSRTVVAGPSWSAAELDALESRDTVAFMPPGRAALADDFGVELTVVHRASPQATMLSIEMESAVQGPWLRPRLGDERSVGATDAASATFAPFAPFAAPAP